MTDTNADMDVKPEEQPIVVEKRDDGIVRPGDLSAKLQACRERADLDQDQAAIAMRLSPAMIKALESENFAELPDPPYVRGYLRSYSRLDESNPQDLIRTYELLRGADPDSLSTPLPTTLTRVHKPSISPTTVRMLGLVALVVFLGILSMIPGINQWVRQTWQSFAAAQPGSAPTLLANQKPVTAASTTPATGTSTNLTASEPAPTTSPAIATTTQDSPIATAGSEAVQPVAPLTAVDPSTTSTEATPTTLGLANPAASSTASTTTTPATPVPDPTAIASATDTSATSTTATTGTATTPTTGTLDPAAATTTTLASSTAATTATPTDPATAGSAVVDPTKPADATATTQQPIDGEVMVRMEFTQEVWMQVKDGSNKSIFESLNSPNTWKQFKTRTPLTFKIGNAPGVKLYLNGQAYDHAKYTRGSVARFTVN